MGDYERLFRSYMQGVVIGSVIGGVIMGVALALWIAKATGH